jgi:hypothetical protein
MKNQLKVISLLIIFLISAFLIGSCNVPESTPSTEDSRDAVYTMAAETVMAHYTQEASDLTEAVVPPTDIPTITPHEISPTLEPSNTLEPSASPTQTETPTPTRIQDAIIEDDFSNTTLWYVAEEDNYGFEYVDGGYRIYNEILNAAIWSYKDQDFQDIQIEVDTTRNEGPDESYYGVICRFANDGNDYYGLVINDSGFYGILKMKDGELEFLDSGLDEDEVVNKEGGVTNRIKGVCIGDQLMLFSNDQKLLEVVDDSLATGVVGLVVGNRLSGVGIDVTFDNFALLWP